MSYKIYLAARFGRHEELHGYATQLRALGYEVVSRWHEPETVHANAKHDSAPTPEQSAAWATDDWMDLDTAEAVISFTEEPRSAEGGRGGRHTEFGMALARYKHCVVVGPREHVFHHLPEVKRFECWELFLEHVQEAWFP